MTCFLELCDQSNELLKFPENLTSKENNKLEEFPLSTKHILHCSSVVAVWTFISVFFFWFYDTGGTSFMRTTFVMFSNRIYNIAEHFRWLRRMTIYWCDPAEYYETHIWRSDWAGQCWYPRMMKNSEIWRRNKKKKFYGKNTKSKNWNSIL